MQFSTPEALYIIFFFSFPFIIYGSLVLYLLLKSIDALHASVLGLTQPPTKGRPRHLLAGCLSIISILGIACGGFLIFHFLNLGGPNQNINQHFFHSDANRYNEFQLGMLILLSGSLLAFIVNGIYRKFSWPRLLGIVALSLVVTIGTSIVLYSNDKKNAAVYDQSLIKTQAELNKLPPIYVPKEAMVPFTPPPYPNRYLLSFVDNDNSGYSISLDSPIKVVGHHLGNTKQLFNPSTNICDLAGLEFGSPSSQPGSCKFVANVNGGIVYASSQPKDTWHRSFLAWEKGDAVYLLIDGGSASDQVNDLELISPTQAINTFFIQ